MNRKISNILITGISGSGGSYLAEYISNNHPEIRIHGISRWHSTSSNKNLEDIADKINVHECDLTDFSSIQGVLKKVNPEIIFHLASYANVRASWDSPLSVIQNNIMGTANLLEAVHCQDMNPIIQMCSTSEVYGQVDPKNVPINESCPLNPANPYAVSKLAQDQLGQVYFMRSDNPLNMITTRMFSYLNPRRKDLFATAFARQVTKIELGLQKELLHGNLDSIRTIIDVRDAMGAYWFAATKGKIGEVYNIGGEKTVSVGEFLEILKENAHCKIPSRIDKSLLRPKDVTLQIPDLTKFKSETGWKPKYSFEESVRHLLEYCRKDIEKEFKK